jgi:uncharacterized membrane protein
MFGFVKTVFFKGLIVLIPLVLLWLTIRELVELLVAFAEPIADFFPLGTFDWVRNPELVAPILIIVVAMLIGIVASIPLVRKAGASLERNTVGRLPLYRMIKTFVTAFLEVEEDAAFRPALIMDDEGGAEPCYVIEDTEGAPNVVVLVPWSPASFAGSVKLVPRSRIKRLDITFDEFSLSLANFGLGMHSIAKLRGSIETPPEH